MENYFSKIEQIESQEKELKREFAQELRNPHKRSYLNKLKRIMGAFVLAGMVLATPREGVTPEMSKELLILRTADLSTEKGREDFKEVIKLYRETGGITMSPQIADRIYKPVNLARQSYHEVFKDKQPYFMKPEIVLGKEFTKSNPEKARQYMEKIKRVIKSTVMIGSENYFVGSGAIINTKKGKIIITNEHVIDKIEKQSIYTEYHNGESAKAKVIAKDKRKDLAILRISAHEVDGEYGKRDLIPDGLDIIEDKSVQKMKGGEKLAHIGNPLGFPFEAVIGEFNGLDQEEDYTVIRSVPDKRFESLAFYDLESGINDSFNFGSKGECMGGMSGGPIVKLEDDETELLGIISMRYIEYTKGSDYPEKECGGISSKDIREFLSKNGY